MFSPNNLLYLIVYTIGFAVRLTILNYPSVTNSLGNRVEISTPVSSWKRAVEGVTLKRHGVNPYDGDIFHESPLALMLYDFILTHLQECIPVVFTLSDLVTAAALSLAAFIYLKDLCKKESEPSKFPATSEPILLKNTFVQSVPFYISVVYLLSPYAIIACGGKSTSVFFNFVVSLFLLSTVSGYWFIASILLAVSAYHSFYHLSLLVPLIMFIYTSSHNENTKKSNIAKPVGAVCVFISTLSSLVYISYKYTGSWRFLWSTYGCILSVPDLTPNIGLFWYFFTEMFEHFRVFFLCTFQLNVFVYLVPLALRLRKEPIFLLFIHLIIIAVFKSYPCVGDLAFYMALLPIWSHLFHFMRQRFIVCCCLASCTLLAPTLWYLWIYSGSANANFYFAITLVFNTGQVFLLTDLLTAYIKREYYLEKGVKYNEDGSLAFLRLQ